MDHIHLPKSFSHPEQEVLFCCSVAIFFTWSGPRDALHSRVYDLISQQALHHDVTIGATAQTILMPKLGEECSDRAAEW